mmetsp:Transcript_111878/g.327138  ORF Transcript_111878/g.327138 Transcript_111878/m.327138 type:complete len:283 (-) Transcript_111878:396-1244(-)
MLVKPRRWRSKRVRVPCRRTPGSAVDASSRTTSRPGVGAYGQAPRARPRSWPCAPRRLLWWSPRLVVLRSRTTSVPGLQRRTADGAATSSRLPATASETLASTARVSAGAACTLAAFGFGRSPAAGAAALVPGRRIFVLRPALGLSPWLRRPPLAGLPRLLAALLLQGLGVLPLLVNLPLVSHLLKPFADLQMDGLQPPLQMWPKHINRLRSSLNPKVETLFSQVCVQGCALHGQVCAFDGQLPNSCSLAQGVDVLSPSAQKGGHDALRVGADDRAPQRQLR